MSDSNQINPLSEERLMEISLMRVTRTFDELLVAAEGIKQLGRLMSAVEQSSEEDVDSGCAIEALGRHVQNLRNEAAEHLGPALKKLGAQPVGY